MEFMDTDSIFPAPLSERASAALLADDGGSVGMVGMEQDFIEAPASASVLMNSLILAKIDRFLSSEDLLTAREVCKDWRQALLPEFRRRHPELKLGPTNARVEDFLDHLKSCDPIPYGKYAIIESRDDISLEEQAEKLVQLGAPYVTSLELASCLPTGTHVIQLLDLIFNKLPNLKELNIDTEPDLRLRYHFSESSRESVGVGHLPNLKRLQFVFGEVENSNQLLMLVELLKAAISLEWLKIVHKAPVEDTSPYKTSPLFTLRDINAPLRTLNTLKMYCLSRQELEVLIELSQHNRRSTTLKLQKLSTSFNVETAFQESWFEFLSYQSATLKRLSIQVEAESSTVSPKDIVLPVLICLEKFKLVIAPRRPQVCIRFGFDAAAAGSMGVCLPALNEFAYRKNVYLCGSSGSSHLPLTFRRKGIFTSSYGHSSLPELRIDGPRLDSAAEFHRMIKLFPRLRVLKIELRAAKLLSKLWRHCSQLEELNVTLTKEPPKYPNTPIDCYITGLTTKRCKDLATKIRRGILLADCESYQALAALAPKKSKLKPGVGYMTNLRILSITFHPLSHKMTDVSGYFGFALMPALTSLTCWPAGQHAISARCQGMIRDKLGLPGFVQF